jgi:hypothetical protein
MTMKRSMTFKAAWLAMLVIVLLAATVATGTAEPKSAGR